MYFKSVACACLILCSIVAKTACAMDDFTQWKQTFRRQALAAGVSAITLNKFLPRMTLLPQVVQADKKQPEFVSTFWEYTDARLTPARIEQGKMLLK